MVQYHTTILTGINKSTVSDGGVFILNKHGTTILINLGSQNGTTNDTALSLDFTEVVGDWRTAHFTTPFTSVFTTLFTRGFTEPRMIRIYIHSLF